MSHFSGRSRSEDLAVLGLEGEASAQEIRKAYLLLVKKHKPDRDPEAFQRLRAAYERLMEEFEPVAEVLTQPGEAESEVPFEGPSELQTTPAQLLGLAWHLLDDREHAKAALDLIARARQMTEASPPDFAPPQLVLALIYKLLTLNRIEAAQLLIESAEKTVAFAGYRAVEGEIVFQLELAREVAFLPPSFPRRLRMVINRNLPQGLKAIEICLGVAALEDPEAGALASQQLHGLKHLGPLSPMLLQPAKVETKNFDSRLLILGCLILYALLRLSANSQTSSFSGLSPGTLEKLREYKARSGVEEMTLAEPVSAEILALDNATKRLCGDRTYTPGNEPYCHILASSRELLIRADCSEIAATPWPERPGTPVDKQVCESARIAFMFFASEVEPNLLTAWNAQRTKCELPPFDFPVRGPAHRLRFTPPRCS